jgi:hypothetical protein
LPDPNPAVCVCDFDPRSVEDQRWIEEIEPHCGQIG